MKQDNEQVTTFQRNGMRTAVLDVLETAAYFGITRDQVYKLVKAGDIPHTRVGKNFRFRIEDLNAYLSSQTSRKWERVDNRGNRKQKECE